MNKRYSAPVLRQLSMDGDIVVRWPYWDYHVLLHSLLAVVGAAAPTSDGLLAAVAGVRLQEGPSVSSVPTVADGRTTSSRFQWPFVASFAAMISGVRLASGRASFMKGCCRYGRKQQKIKHRSLSLRFVGRSTLLDIHREALVKEVLKDGAQFLLLLDLRLAVGSDQVERSERILVQPRRCLLPTLTFGPYCFRVTTSGAIQYGVPTIVVRFDCSGEIWAQKPKSVSFTLPSSPSSMLSLLMSRWMTWLLWRNSSACSTSRQTAAIWPSSMHVSVTTSVSEPPGRYSITTHSSSDTR
uniref:Uncharacterized protein n=1 Tax=Anopheles farauti TaxID=69004 RepID=A0A182QWS2_9DIPT